MRSFVATSVLSIARRLCLRDASIVVYAVGLVVVMSFAGCGGSTNGSVQQKTTPTITWPTPAAITYGTALSGTQLDATASVAGMFAYAPAVGTAPAAGTQTISVTFTPTDTTDYNTATGSVRLVVNQATPTVSVWPTASAITVGQALSASTLTGGAASVSGAFAWTTPSTVPAVGTDSESVTFTPTDTVDYATVVSSVSVVVNPTTPQITAGTRYSVSDAASLSVPETLTCEGCEAGDILHDANGIFADLTLPSAETTLNFTNAWEEGDFQPTCDGSEVQHPSGPYGNIWYDCFLGSASQSTLAISASTGTQFQVQQEAGQVYTRTTSGTTGPLSGNTGGTALTPGDIAVDDITTNAVYLFTGENDIAVFTQSGTRVCDVTPGMSFVSSIAAKGGYMVFADPTDNKVGIAKMDCTGFITISVAGQPWAVAMSGSDAYVLSRDNAGNGVPRITKISVPSGTVEGFVDLTGIPTVTSIRATTPYEGLHQVVAFNTIATADVLFMSDSTDGVVLTISTNTASGAKMAVTYSTPIADIPVAIAPQETGSVTKPVLWIGYLPADTGGNVMDVGALDPSTGEYTSNVGSCPAGLIGGFAAGVNGLQCAGDSTISAPLALAYSSY